MARIRIREGGKLIMNINTGEIRMLENLTKKEKSELFKEGFREVPEELEEEAKKELAGQERAFVDARKRTSLNTWAKMHVGRNDACPCGSGKKYKKCCLPKDEERLLEKVRQQRENRGLKGVLNSVKKTAKPLREATEHLKHTTEEGGEQDEERT
jgi:hypothetical protein